MLPSAELLPLSASPSLSQGQVGVTGTAGPAGARGRSVSHLVSLSPFGMIADGGGGHICDQEHRAGLKLVSPGFFLTPKQGSTGLRGPPGPQGLEGAKVREGDAPAHLVLGSAQALLSLARGGRSGDLGQTLAPRAEISKARSLPGTELGAFPFLPQGDPGPRGRDGPTGAAGLEVLLAWACGAGSSPRLRQGSAISSTS